MLELIGIVGCLALLIILILIVINQSNSLKAQLEKNDPAVQLSHFMEGLKEINNNFVKLHTSLSNPKIRGSWGERIAKDIIDKIGLKEGIQYVAQTKDENTGNIPDFTFKLPNGLKCNMDSKFPLVNYLNYHNSTDKQIAEGYLDKFIKDSRTAIKSISKKEYIGEGTTNFALIFIPNEQVLYTLMEHDPEIMDFAFENKVILCSPWSLYSVLSIIHTACEMFTISETIIPKIKAIQKFNDQWQKFKDEDSKIDKKIDDILSVRSSITGTRTRMLEKALEIE